VQELNESPAEYGVIGHPVAHSRSPFIHGIFAKQTGQNMVYRPHDVPPEELHSYVMQFWRRGGRGLNVTVPHKVSARTLVRALSERGLECGTFRTAFGGDAGADESASAGEASAPAAGGAPLAEAPARGHWPAGR